MPDKPQANITLQLPEVAKLLCPKCQDKLQKLLAEKIAERAMQGA